MSTILDEHLLHATLRQLLPCQNERTDCSFTDELHELGVFGIHTVNDLEILVLKHREAVLDIDGGTKDDQHIRRYAETFGEDGIDLRPGDRCWLAHSGLLRIILELEFGDAYMQFAQRRDEPFN